MRHKSIFRFVCAFYCFKKTPYSFLLNGKMLFISKSLNFNKYTYVTDCSFADLPLLIYLFSSLFHFRHKTSCFITYSHHRLFTSLITAYMNVLVFSREVMAPLVLLTGRVCVKRRYCVETAERIQLVIGTEAFLDHPPVCYKKIRVFSSSLRPL